MKTFALLILFASASMAQPTNLAGPWKLKVDDNLRWAQPDIDDSGWPTVMLPDAAR